MSFNNTAFQGCVKAIREFLKSEGVCKPEYLHNTAFQGRGRDIGLSSDFSPHPMSLTEKLLFLKNFLRNPLRNASIIPSSPQAARAVLTDLDWSTINVIIELGPGNGTFTKEILNQCKPDAFLILIELEDSYISLLKNKFGNRIHVLHDSAEHLHAILKNFGFEKADLIVSSLPFLPNPVREKINKAILQETENGAAFRFFTYMPPVMKKFYSGMPLRKIKFVLKNIPPMWIYGIN